MTDLKPEEYRRTIAGLLEAIEELETENLKLSEAWTTVERDARRVLFRDGSSLCWFQAADRWWFEPKDSPYAAEAEPSLLESVLRIRHILS